MLEKRELNQEELEKVASGASSPGAINWRFSKDAEVQVILEDNTKVSGKVTKRGYFHVSAAKTYHDLYYVESETNPSVNKWYFGQSFVNNTVRFDPNIYGEAVVYPW